MAPSRIDGNPGVIPRTGSVSGRTGFGFSIPIWCLFRRDARGILGRMVDRYGEAQLSRIGPCASPTASQRSLSRGGGLLYARYRGGFDPARTGSRSVRDLDAVTLISSRERGSTWGCSNLRRLARSDRAALGGFFVDTSAGQFRSSPPRPLVLGRSSLALGPTDGRKKRVGRISVTTIAHCIGPAICVADVIITAYRDLPFRRPRSSARFESSRRYDPPQAVSDLSLTRLRSWTMLGTRDSAAPPNMPVESSPQSARFCLLSLDRGSESVRAPCSL